MPTVFWKTGRRCSCTWALGSRESYDSWLSFLHAMTARGLKKLLLVTSDKHKGLKKGSQGGIPSCLQTALPGSQDEEYPVQAALED